MTTSTANRTATKSTTGQTKQALKNLNQLRSFLPKDEISDQQLETSLKSNGQLSPIVRLNGTIVDGERRLRMLKKLGIKPWIVDISKTTALSSQGSPVSLANPFFEINGCRQNLNDAVRAAMADSLATMKKGANQHTAAADGAMSLAQAAAAMGTSADSIGRWRAIKGDPVLRAAALSGTSTLSACVLRAEGQALAAAAGASAHLGKDISVTLRQCAAKGLQFGLVYADPAWDYNQSDKAPTGVANPKRHYPVMSLKKIKEMPVRQVCAKNSVLYLWTPNCLIADAMEVMKAWGFKYVTSAVWIKTSAPPTKGAIHPFHETLLMGKRGRGISTGNKLMKSFFEEEVTVHSRKPSWFAEELERLYPHKQTGKVEFFCRQPRAGWSCLGNQAKGPATAVKAVKAVKAPAKPSTKKAVGTTSTRKVVK